ncbi:MAG: hypothetical protein Q4D07_07330 [Selenomonadaceae bacterium]|nr:hypothetical protein [Selenomonadaceae bacterium]
MSKTKFTSGLLRTGVALCCAVGLSTLTPAPAVFTPVCAAAAADDMLPEIAEIRSHTLYAWAALVSRDDHIGEAARHTLQTMGYDVSSVQLDSPKGNAEYNIITAKDDNGVITNKIIVMRGTPTLSSSANLSELAPVFFEGGNPFAEAATSTAQRKIIEPKVHHGFDLRVTSFFFSPDANGNIVGHQLADELKQNPNMKLSIVGHGDSGALATILGARLLNLSVPREQLEVVTFGAPPVGNVTFGSYYLHRLPLTRITMRTDAISNLLNKAPDDYVQYGEKKVWTASKTIDTSTHEMTTYLDSALHIFFDKAATYPAPQVKEGDTKIYVAPISFNLDNKLAADQLYMDEALTDSLRRMYPGAVFTLDQQETVAQSIASAKRMGAKFIIVESVNADRTSLDRENVLRLSLSETIYNTDGSLVFYQESATRLKKISPVEACLYNQISLKEARDAAMTSATGGNAVPRLTISL